MTVHRHSILLAAVAAGVVALGPAHAQQGLNARVTERCVRAAVKIVALSADGTGSTGSGSIIDPRGYVLTNFHVVGHTRPDGGVPGTLLNPRNRIELATVENARQAARPRWIGAVVRADTRLDLALVRIISDTNGSPVTRMTFPTVQLGGTTRLRPGARLYALGYPLGVRTINLSSGTVTGFQMNSRNQISWIRSDAEFNPGNSGGMLVDDRGRLVAVPTAVVSGERTLEPIELARPIDRVPSDWLAALRRGHIDDTRIDGVPMLREGREVDAVALGDAGGLEGPELHFYRMPRTRPALIRTTPRLPIAVANVDGRVLRRGRGEVEVSGEDPPDTVLAVFLESGDDTAISYRVRFEAVAAPVAPPEPPPQIAQAPPQPPPVAQPPPQPPPQQPPPQVMPNPFVGGPGIPVPAGPPPPVGTIRPLGPPRPAGQPPIAQPGPGMPQNASFVRGRLLDALSGRPVAGMVIIGRPGLDIARHLELFLAGRMGEAQFEAALAGFSRTDVHGTWEIPALGRGQRYPGAGMAQGYRPRCSPSPSRRRIRRWSISTRS
jgi:serine protease Do